MFVRGPRRSGTCVCGDGGAPVSGDSGGSADDQPGDGCSPRSWFCGGLVAELFVVEEVGLKQVLGSIRAAKERRVKVANLAHSGLTPDSAVGPPFEAHLVVALLPDK